MAVDLPFIPAYLRVGVLFGDTDADPDREPDVVWADEGTVTLEPVIGNLKVADENGKLAVLGNASKVGVIKPGGRIAWDHDPTSDDNNVIVVDLTDPSLETRVENPDGKTHTMTFRGVRSNGAQVFGASVKPFNVRISADTATEGVVNLASQIPASAAGPIIVDLGPQGVGVVDAVQPSPGKLALELSDGSLTDEIDLPAGTLPDDPSLAAALGGTATQAALNAQIVEAATPATIYARDYCAEDGVTDDGPGIAAALTALSAAGGGTLRLSPGKNYLVGSAVDVNVAGKSINIVATGASVTAGTQQVGIRLAGSMAQLAGGDAAYTATSLGARQITTANNLTSALSVGDLIMVWSSDVDNPERPNDYLSGEPAWVTGISSTIITLDRALQLAHTSGAERRLYRITPARVRVEGLDLRAGVNAVGQRLFEVKYSDDVELVNCAASGKSARFGYLVAQSLNVRIVKPRVSEMWESGNPTDPLGYGLWLNGVIGGVVDAPRGSRVRHVVDVGSFSSSSQPGFVSTDIVTRDGEATETWAPAWSTHHGRNIAYDDCRALNCGGGFVMRAIGWRLRKPKIVGGHLNKPAEWSVTRAVASAVTIGENDTLLDGAGLAGSDVLIDSLEAIALPTSFDRIRWVDAPGSKVSIIGPGEVNAPGVLASDSISQPDGAPGKMDLAYGYRPTYGGWEWAQGSAGVVIAGNRFTRPSGTGLTSLRTSADAPADAEVSATWNLVGTPSSSVVLCLRGGSTLLNDWIGAGVNADGSVVLLKRVGGGGIATIGSATVAGTVVDGDVLTFQAQRRTLRALVNGRVVVEAFDSSILTAGRAGFFFRAAGGDGWAASKFRLRTLAPA